MIAEIDIVPVIHKERRCNPQIFSEAPPKAASKSPSFPLHFLNPAHYNRAQDLSRHAIDLKAPDLRSRIIAQITFFRVPSLIIAPFH